MGYRRVPTIYTLDKIKDEDGLIVRIKGISFGKVRSLLRLMDDDTQDQSVMDALSAPLAANIVSWNLETEDGAPVPLEELEDQDFGLVLAIVGAWLDAITGPDDELGKDSSSGVRFPGQPLTMEAL